MDALTNDQILYAFLMSHLGTPYQWGGPNRLTGLDCSGLVLEFLTAAGKWTPGQDTTAAGIYAYFVKQEAKAVDCPAFGDLCFYGKDTAGISHIAIALNNKLMIEAGGGRSTTINLAKAKEQGALVRVRPIRLRKDLVAVLKVGV